MTRVENRRVELRTDDGLVIKDGHIDDMVVVPPDFAGCEKKPLDLQALKQRVGPAPWDI